MIQNAYLFATAMVLDEATERFSPNYRINADRIEQFRNCCDTLCSEALMEKLECTGFNIAVDEHTHRITITLYMDSLDLGSAGFRDILSVGAETEGMHSIGVYAEDNMLCVDFVMNGIWEEVQNE